MGKYLKLGTDPNVEPWTLPDDVSVDEVQKQLDAAMTEGGAARIRVIVRGTQSGELLVNGKALVAALVWEDERAKPTFTLID